MRYKIRSTFLPTGEPLLGNAGLCQAIQETLAMFDRGEDLSNSPFIQSGEWKGHKDCHQTRDSLETALTRQKDVIKLYRSIKKHGYNGSTVLVWFDDEGYIHLYDGFHRMAIMNYLGLVSDVNVETEWEGLDSRIGRDFPLAQVLEKEAPGGQWLYQPVEDARLKGWKVDRRDSPKRLEYILNNLTGNTVLDIGCSEGYFSRELAKKGYKVVAIDQRPGLIAAARYLSTIEGLEVDYHIGGWHDVLGGSQPYDNILFLSILHNDIKRIGVEAGLEKLQAFRGKAKRVFFEVPNNTNERQWMRDGFPKFDFHASDSQALVSSAMSMDIGGEHKGLRSIFLFKNERPKCLKEVHFISTGRDFPYMYYLSVLSALKTQKVDAVNLWITQEPRGKYFQMVKDKVSVIKTDAPHFLALDNLVEQHRNMFMKDYIGWKVLYERGGILLDLDTFCLEDISELIGDKEVLAPIDFSNSRYPFNGAICGAKLRSGIVKSILDEVEVRLNQNEIGWSEAGPILFSEHLSKSLDRVATPEFGVCGGNREDRRHALWEDDETLWPNARVLHLFSAGLAGIGKGHIKIDEKYIETSSSLYARCVRQILKEEESMWDVNTWLKKRGKHYKPLFEYLRSHDCLNIMEVGTWNGENAIGMIKIAAERVPEDKICYYGFDLFDEITPELIDQEFSFNSTPSDTEVRSKLEAKTKAKITLFKGNTKSTLQESVKNLPNMDLIYIDGGHSIETIRNDWKWASLLIKPKSVVFFDDFFPEIPSIGCKFISSEIDKSKYDVEVLPETDTYSKEWGRLTTQLVRVQLKTSSWRKVPDEEWNHHIASESRYWGTCQNTFDNQLKQQCYVKYMGLNDYAAPASEQRGQHLYGFDLKGKSVLDIGGGPVSLLLRCYNFSRAVVVDPCDFPGWVVERYKLAGIEFINQKAEVVKFDQKFDEAWMYNCLQHVQDPVKVVNMAMKSAYKVRVCEPRCEVGIGPAHPHNLTKENLDSLFHKVGTAESVPLTEVRGQVPTKLSYYGVFDYGKREEPKEVNLVMSTPVKPSNNRYRFHVLGLAHTKTNLDYVLCGYTQKVYKMCQMMMDLGHEVYHYGAEGSNPPCTENIQVITDAEQRRVYGDFDWHKYYWRYSANDEAHKIFNSNAAREIDLRKQPRDMLLISNGVAQKATADAVGDVVAIETGIGYLGVFAKYKVFESYAWMHHIYGLRDAPHGSCDIKYYDCVIPNYYNPDDFEYSDTKDDYYLYVGRLIPRKGVHIAAQAVDKVGGKLIVAGQGDIKNLGLDSHNVEHIGTVARKGRSDLMRKAKALFVPTIYLEPFGGVAIEANFCGTPVITTDFGAFTETVKHGVTGYRCKTMDDFIWAANNVGKINPEDCRKHAEANYSMARVSKMYDEYFHKVYDLFGDGWYAEHPERKQLDWLRTY